MKHIITVDNYPFPKPQPSLRDWRAWSLLVPGLVASIGFWCFGVLAFSFTELQQLPIHFRTTLVVIGAFALAFGGEVGTLPATVEIFRKARAGEAMVWDWIALAISATSTFVVFLMSFAALLGLASDWPAFFRSYGAVALGLCSAFDAYATFAEFGLYLATYDKRLQQYQTDA